MTIIIVNSTPRTNIGSQGSVVQGPQGPQSSFVNVASLRRIASVPQQVLAGSTPLGVNPLTFDTLQYNSGTQAASTTPSVQTITAPGIYEIGSSLYFIENTQGAAGVVKYLSIYLGRIVQSGALTQTVIGQTSATGPALTVSTIQALQAGDNISIWAAAEGTQALTVASNDGSAFSIAPTVWLNYISPTV